MLAQNVRQNFELLYARREMLPLVSTHRTRIFEAIMAGKPEEAREASHRHLAFIEEIMLDRSREESRRERAFYAARNSARISFFWQNVNQKML